MSPVQNHVSPAGSDDNTAIPRIIRPLTRHGERCRMLEELFDADETPKLAETSDVLLVPIAATSALKPCEVTSQEIAKAR